MELDGSRKATAAASADESPVGGSSSELQEASEAGLPASESCKAADAGRQATAGASLGTSHMPSAEEAANGVHERGEAAQHRTAALLPSLVSSSPMQAFAGR